MIAEDPVSEHQAFWATKRASLQSEYPAFIEKYPDADTQYRKLLKALCTIEDVAGCTPTAVGESAEWMAIVSTTEENWASCCKALSGKTLYSALYGTYIVALQELKALLKVSTTTPQTAKKPTQEEDFQEVRRRKRHSSNEAARTPENIGDRSACRSQHNTQDGAHQESLGPAQDSQHGHRSF
jgi:prophage DNA circulation protein